MKVLHIINDLTTGGAEKLLVDTLNKYNERGIETDLLLLKQSENIPFRQLIPKGVDVYSLGKKSEYNPILIPKIMPYLKRYDIVHVHLFPSLYWVALAALLSRSKIKLVFTEHSTNNRRMKSKIFGKIDKSIYSRYDRIIAITDEVGESLKHAYSIPSKKISTINNGVDIEKIYASKRYDKNDFGYETSDILMIMVAAFRHEKDQDTVIRSLNKLPENVKLILVGDGERRSTCEELTNSLGLTSRVNFMGIRTDVPQLLKMADICVLSSHWEGFGLSAVEGMAAERPLVASDVVGLSSIVKDAGLLFPKGNDDELAQKVKHLIGDSLFYQETAQKGKERSSLYGIDKMVDKTIELYNEIINE